MKKIFSSIVATVLAATCVFGITACGEEDDSPVDLAGKNIYFHFQGVGDIVWDSIAYTHYYEDTSDGYKGYSAEMTMQEFAETYVGTDVIYTFLSTYKELYEKGAEEYNLDTVDGVKAAIKNYALGIIGESNPRLVFYSDASKATAYRYGDTDLREALETYTVQKDGEFGYHLHNEGGELVGSLYSHGKENIKVIGNIFPTSADLRLFGQMHSERTITLTADDGSTIERPIDRGKLIATLEGVNGFSVYRVSRT